MTTVGAFVLLLIGVWLFTQGTLGDLTKRLLSFAGGDEPARASSTAVLEVGPLSRSQRAHAIRVPRSIPRGPSYVWDVLAVACHRLGGGWTCISWSRPGSFVRGDRSNPSCHGAKDKRTRKIGKAMDLVPPDRNGDGEPDWGLNDKLNDELNAMRNTPINGHRVGEVVWRGDSDHDPALGARHPHLHAAVDCG